MALKEKQIIQSTQQTNRVIYINLPIYITNIHYFKAILIFTHIILQDVNEISKNEISLL